VVAAWDACVIACLSLSAPAAVLNATVKLAFQHPDLVTEDEELDILVRLAASGRDYERQDPADAEI
jgi:hypothetical protein